MAIREVVQPVTYQSQPQSSARSFRRGPLLTLIPTIDLEERVKDNRVFATVIGVIAALTFAGLLTVNTLLTQDAITVQKLKLEALQLNEDREATIKNVEEISNPSALASAALSLGMKPSENPQFLDLSAVKP